MLSVILKILSILGIILLVLLGVLLTVILLVLFFPICYRMKGDRQPESLCTKTTGSSNPETSDEEAPKWLVHADVKAWWLFGLLRAGYQYPNPGVFKVKFLCFTLYHSGREEKGKRSSQSKEGSLTEKKQVVGGTDEAVDKTTNKTTDKSAAEAKKTTESGKNLSLFEKIQYTIEKFCDKIKNVFEKLKEIRENITYYKEIFSSDEAKGLLEHAFMRLGKILKSIRPRRLKADIHYGAASPDTTGYVCAVYGMICSYLGKHVVFNPDFEQEILEGTIYAAGHITVFKVLWNGMKIATDRRLWLLKDKLTSRN